MKKRTKFKKRKNPEDLRYTVLKLLMLKDDFDMHLDENGQIIIYTGLGLDENDNIIDLNKFKLRLV